MKVSAGATVEVSDEQRSKIADVLDEKRSSRWASRDEMKEYIWGMGATWRAVLTMQWNEKFGPEAGAEPAAESEEQVVEEDLLGDIDESDLI